MAPPSAKPDAAAPASDPPSAGTLDACAGHWAAFVADLSDGRSLGTALQPPDRLRALSVSTVAVLCALLALSFALALAAGKRHTRPVAIIPAGFPRYERDYYSNLYVYPPAGALP